MTESKRFEWVELSKRCELSLKVRRIGYRKRQSIGRGPFKK
jgi:hypothetical protein